MQQPRSHTPTYLNQVRPDAHVNFTETSTANTARDAVFIVDEGCGHGCRICWLKKDFKAKNK
jgi:hypothetical protein